VKERGSYGCESGESEEEEVVGEGKGESEMEELVAGHASLSGLTISLE